VSTPREFQLELTSDAAELPGARSDLRAWVEQHGWSEQQVGEIVLALDEAITNVIRHGYKNATGQRIEILARMIDDPAGGEGLEIQVRDFGRQVDPKEICGRDLEDVRPGGLGVHIIHAMNSEVKYECAEGGGMRLTMRKYRTHTAEAVNGETEDA
jgi:anti-sigma regulatory factor (Ser/Thr protein kinase)